MKQVFLFTALLIILLVCSAFFYWKAHRQNQAFFRCVQMLIRDESTMELLEQNKAYRILPHAEQELLGSLSLQLEETSTAEILKKEAELHALQNQINPHFLYNTLEVIRSRAMKQNVSDVAEMVESLAMQFRYCINSTGDMATLQQELDHVKNYLLIQRYRLGDRFKYQEIIHDPEGIALKSHMPVMTLQPVIENSLMHGINPKIEGGTITVRIGIRGQRLLLAIEDDGIGMSEEALVRMRRKLNENAPARRENEKGASNGIAMQNVNQRIKVYFGEQYGIDITSTQGVGTSVFITLPLAV